MIRGRLLCNDKFINIDVMFLTLYEKSIYQKSGVCVSVCIENI